MNVVVDASVAAKWLFLERDSERATALLREVGEGRLRSLAPEILPAEIGNVLAVRVLRGWLREQQAWAEYERFQRSCPALISNKVLAEPALRLALRQRHSIYDCLYLALALVARCDLITADEELHRAFSPYFPQVRLLHDWHPEV
jgi:predicted nucleic acid-binding protein